MSHLPCSVDGTCNGLQHLSALLRDPEGAAAVNLAPGDKPADVYQIVADKVTAQLDDILRTEQDHELAGKWRPLVTRKVVKRGVMTLPYGATRAGFTDQIIDDTLFPLASAGQSPFAKIKPAADFLAGLLWDAAGETVRGAMKAMRWLQSVAKAAAKAGQAIEWVAPSGFPVRHAYYRDKAQRIDTVLSGHRVQLQIREDSEHLDSKKMAAAISPNFVHSLDAAHLLATVELFDDAVPGASLSLVHDAFATHAAHLDVLGSCLREAFVAQYADSNLLADFRAQVHLQLRASDVAVPHPPEQGGFAIEDVRRSEYFFG